MAEGKRNKNALRYEGWIIIKERIIHFKFKRTFLTKKRIELTLYIKIEKLWQIL